MSRKCPRRNHFFLNWLKVNRHRFNFQLQVTQIQKRRISFCFQGITSSLKFYLWITPSGGPWFSINAVMPGKEEDELNRFFGGEMQTSEGWITLRQPPENQRLWPTREKLWEELCLEAFLKWCNTDLKESRWLEINIGSATSARLHREKPHDVNGSTQQFVIEVHVKK